jgi:hypothetical protein
MNSLLKYLLLVVSGVLIGVFGMYFYNNSESPEETTVDLELTGELDNQGKKKKKKNSNSFPKGNFTENPDSTVNLDSLAYDSLLIEDTISFSDEEYFEIVSERLIAHRNVPIQLVKPDSLDASEILNLKADSYSKNIIVEFWESPLDLIGYELNRSRLKLFGFNADEAILIKRNYDSEKLIVQIGPSSNSLVLSLEKSPKFKSIILK